MSRPPSPEISPVDDEGPLPKIVDIYGRYLDPVTGVPHPEGQDGPQSIFRVPWTPPGHVIPARIDKFGTIPETMRKLRRLGFKGDKVVLNITPRPGEEDESLTIPLPRASPSNELYEIASGSIYRTTCAHCWAVVSGKQKRSGFTLRELYQSALQGCETCDVLQRSIRHFADLLFMNHDDQRVRVSQSENGPHGLLAETKKVLVCFEEYEEQTILLDFDGLNQKSTSKTTSQGRITDTSSFATIKLIKGWLKTCTEEHSACLIQPISPLPRRVLDISNSRVRLVENSDLFAPYVALSHCWGRQTVTQLTTATLEAMKENIPWTTLTKTFQDAVIIAWKLGFRYLWIDGLCILQDSKEDWEYNVSRMCQIFSNSQLTIAASRGADGAQGCFSSRLHEPLVLHSTDGREILNPLLWQPYEIKGKDKDGCRKMFTVVLKHQHGLYRRKRPNEPLLRRAWVFQEQILSPRIVHFASGELYFECRSHVTCECSGWQPRSESLQWETRWRKAHAVLKNPDLDQDPGLDPTIQIQREFEAYQALIEAYTELDITEELDRLPALSGVTLGRRDDYLAGMWRNLLLESLHWMAAPKTLRGVMARRPYKYRAPTWSWCSMEAPIWHVEKEFYTYKYSARLVAMVIEASCAPEGQDPRGRVTGGYLRIQGPLLEVRVTDIGLCERKKSASEEMEKTFVENNPIVLEAGLLERKLERHLYTYATVRNGDSEGRCYLDVPLAICQTEPSEVAIGDSLTILAISSSTGLVLTPVPSISGSFSRVGTFRPEDKSHCWTFDAGMDSIIIV